MRKKKSTKEYAVKIQRILALSDWTQDHMADLLGVSNITMSWWARGRRTPKERYITRIDFMYEGIVVPHEAGLRESADRVEREILEGYLRGKD
ncbi:helix-turn-helix transcriptional regulator [Candidatus Saccharibacteria bacterium]|nr:helix-turn-helix transcriptional regulator [Candidatus Saccharibacteria bacterium]